MKAVIYHNARCSKSRQACSYLAEKGVEAQVIKYLENPPSVTELRELLSTAGVTPHEAIRTNEAEYSELGLSPDTPAEELLAAMVAHPRLIQRPIVVTDKGVVIARPTELIDRIL
ncbi:Arsenate reductase [Corynebacterium kalinowskii]|uniref:Arsenate reductase n=1 Tax=Corynebacterium kalinowskii TaxID=2675216 RepID=A0A6B8VLU0_9CORY|nr:arsenate reductase (glutaredoxin) [Corynebacterium kalinowskii]QGU02414.1 Arsenate reductase [Corynebacterium kalinowskii]